jgi:hypothetical protein
MGNIEDDFLPYENKATPSRSGRVYAVTDAKVRTVKVDSVMVDDSEFEAVRDFLSVCSSRRFTVTVDQGTDCGTIAGGGSTRTIYTQCLIQGSPTHSKFERKISGFEFAYTDSVIKTS